MAEVGNLAFLGVRCKGTISARLRLRARGSSRFSIGAGRSLAIAWTSSSETADVGSGCRESSSASRSSYRRILASLRRREMAKSLTTPFLNSISTTNTGDIAPNKSSKGSLTVSEMRASRTRSFKPCGSVSVKLL